MLTTLKGDSMKLTNNVSDLSLYAALFLDIVAWDEGLQEALIRDYHWLVANVASRGISFCMIDMPEAGKTVDSALSGGRLWRGMLPSSFWKARVPFREFLFLSELLDKVFDDEGFLRPDVETKAIRFLRQVLYLAKKVEKECGDAATLAEVETYRQLDASLRSPSLCWLGDALDFPERKLSLRDGYRSSRDMLSYRDQIPVRLLSYIQKTADILTSRFPVVDWRDVQPRHGPGAVADQRSGKDKYTFPAWPAKLERIFPFNYFGMSREDLSPPDVTYPPNRECPVRLLAVPKTLKGPRMIASEPVAHQYIQLGLMRWFRENLPKPLLKSISFKNQDHSRDLCLKASLDGRLATVDLSSASDRLSCWVVERIFRSNPSILEALHACRSRWLVNATGLGEQYFITLKKYAPMGNGTTFPVQSIVYAIISIACSIYEKGESVTYQTICSHARDIRVFGDDIILPSLAVPSLVQALDHLDLRVNRAKTHFLGHFRESCGMDAYKGVDVTPLYARGLEPGTTATSLVSWVDVCKNAALKGLPNLSYHMEGMIPHELRSLLPRSTENLGCLTLWSYFPGTYGGKRRYNKRLHRWEVLGLQAQTKDVRRKRESYANLLQYFIEAPAPDSFWSSGFVVRKRSLLRKRWVPIS